MTATGMPSVPDARQGAGADEVVDTSESGVTGQSWRRDAVRLVLLFLGTRLALTVIGLVTRSLVPGVPFRPTPAGTGPLLSRYPFLDLWGLWDSSWYLNIAEVGYNTERFVGVYANYAFFPLFPVLARVVGWPIGSSYVGGLIVSNASLLVASVYLFRLVLLDDDAETARRTVKYLYVAPGAFLLSAFLTESLYLALVVATFYYARTRRWWLVGVLGLLLTLSRGPGVFTAVPLLWMYLSQRGFSLRRIRPDVLWLLGLPLGIGVFMWVNHEVTGDALAFVKIQRTVWHHYLQNPFTALWGEMTRGDQGGRFNAWYVLVVLGISIAFLRKLGVAYGAFVLISVLMPIAYGPNYYSMVRYTLVVFPLYIAAARFTRHRPDWDQALTIGMALFQGFLMTVWVNVSYVVV